MPVLKTLYNCYNGYTNDDKDFTEADIQNIKKNIDVAIRVSSLFIYTFIIITTASNSSCEKISILRIKISALQGRKPIFLHACLRALFY
jgi:beta-N-acetylglucosaminidase